MSDVYCFYSGSTVEDGVKYGGTTFMKTRQGDAGVVFSTPDLAQSFARRVPPVSGNKIIPLSCLGDAAHPWNPKIPLPPPSMQILFSSEDLIAEWAADKEHFNTAPHVSPIATQRPNQSLEPTAGRRKVHI